MRSIYLCGLLLSCMTTVCYANDSAGTIAAGGIHFNKTTAIAMEQEQLTISPTEITVRYHFKNVSNKPVTLTMLFPLPTYKVLGANTTWDKELDPEVQKRKHIPLLNFKVTSNGQSVQYRTITRAVMGKQDITHILDKAHIPLNTELFLGNLPLDDQQQKLHVLWQQKAKQLGLVDQKQQPRWQKQIIFTWQQTFPANTTVIIEHSYRPSAGIFYSADMPTQTVRQTVAEDIQRMQEIFNLAAPALVNFATFKQCLIKRIQANKKPQCTDCRADKIYAYFINVDYILTTGANWSGPIKRFSLLIKHPPDGAIAYNHFYAGQTVKERVTSGSRQMVINNFVPKHNLRILYGTTTLAE